MEEGRGNYIDRKKIGGNGGWAEGRMNEGGILSREEGPLRGPYELPLNGMRFPVAMGGRGQPTAAPGAIRPVP